MPSAPQRISAAEGPGEPTPEAGENGLATSVIYGLSIVTGSSGTGVEAALEFGVNGLGLSELVFKDDDATRCIEGGAAIDQFTSPRGDPQLIAGVAAVTALGALRSE